MRRRGFTLIELLVVVSIIALLIAILLPSLSKARQTAKSVVCASQLRGLGFAWLSYMQESNYRAYKYPGSSNEAFDHFWMAIIERYTTNVDGLRVCPEAREMSAETWGWGAATISWSGEHHPAGFWIHNAEGDYHFGSYAINGWMYDGWVKGESYRSFLEPGVPTYNAPMFIDSAWVDVWPRDTDLPAVDRIDPYHGGNWSTGMPRVTIDRHDFGVNVVFHDGSTRYVKLPELWSLNWSLKFETGPSPAF
ncbi:prepilin-type N-terminal cleavage/methylation domain-containing protein [Planctomycetales bacterium ZRK34]|nr:prepilin-type N-terminal cleavage/methylation domain-containing protein [Planctomycetales bacterium ZRK34]